MVQLSVPCCPLLCSSVSGRLDDPPPPGAERTMKEQRRQFTGESPSQHVSGDDPPSSGHDATRGVEREEMPGHCATCCAGSHSSCPSTRDAHRSITVASSVTDITNAKTSAPPTLRAPSSSARGIAPNNPGQPQRVPRQAGRDTLMSVPRERPSTHSTSKQQADCH